jgi:hypothetical protein
MAYRVALVVVVVVCLARLLALVHGLVAIVLVALVLCVVVLLLCGDGRLGGAVEIVVFFVHGGLLVPEGRRGALFEVPGDKGVAGGFERGLDVAGACDDVAVLVALDVVVRIAEQVEELAALQAKAKRRGAAVIGRISPRLADAMRLRCGSCGAAPARFLALVSRARGAKHHHRRDTQTQIHALSLAHTQHQGNIAKLTR